MLGNRVSLISGLTDEQADRVSLLLAAMQIEVASERDGAGFLSLFVSAADAQQAHELLEEEFPYGLTRPEPDAQSRTHDPFADPEVLAPETWFGRGTPCVLGVIAACVVVFVALVFGPEGATRPRLIDFGAIVWSLVEQGEHWRLVTAIFLHFSAVHLFSNMSALLVTGPPLAHIVGARYFLLLFLATGVAGNVLSHVAAPSLGLKAGASGAIAGVIGALGGQALRPRPGSRFKAWQRLGAIAAFYGLLVGFGPGRDNVAHLGGLIAGLLLGRLIPPMPQGSPLDALRAQIDRPRSS